MNERVRSHFDEIEARLIECPVRRLDNAPHHTDLPYAPNHLHIGADHIEGFSGNPDIFAFIDKIERNFNSHRHSPPD